MVEAVDAGQIRVMPSEGAEAARMDGSAEYVGGEQGLVDLLEFEVERIREDDARQGWTARAQIGALGAIGWLALSQVSGSVSVSTVGGWMLVAAVLLAMSRLFETLGLLITIDEAPASSHPEVVPFGDVLSSSKKLSAWKCSRDLFVAASVWAWVPSQNPLVLWGTRAITGFEAVGSVVMLVISLVAGRAPFALRYQPGDSAWIRRFAIKVGLGSAVESALVAGALCVTWAWGTFVPSVLGLKMGALMFAGLFLLGTLAKRGSRPPLAATLVSLRREVGLGLVDVRSARERTRIALIGLKAVDVLQREVADQLDALGRIQRQIRKMNDRVRGMNAMLGSGGQSLSWEELAVAESVLEAVVSDRESIQETFDAYSKKASEFREHVKHLGRICPGAIEPMSALVDSLVAAARETLGSLEGTTSEVGVLRGEVKRRAMKEAMAPETG